MLASERLTVDAKGAAELMGICVRTVRKMLAEGELPYVRLGSRVLINVDTLRAYLIAKECVRKG